MLHVEMQQVERTKLKLSCLASATSVWRLQSAQTVLAAAVMLQAG